MSYLEEFVSSQTVSMIVLNLFISKLHLMPHYTLFCCVWGSYLVLQATLYASSLLGSCSFCFSGAIQCIRGWAMHSGPLKHLYRPSILKLLRNPKSAFWAWRGSAVSKALPWQAANLRFYPWPPILSPEPCWCKLWALSGVTPEPK